MDMKKILQALDGASSKPVEGSNDMKKFMQIVEGKGPLNRLTAAESMAVQHFQPEKTITTPVLNVAKDAKPSMIGKYFKTVEQEFKEAAERNKDKATRLAERVIERVVPGQETPPGINRLTGKPIEPEPAKEPSSKPSGGSMYDPRLQPSGEAYTINVGGKIYKFAGRDKTGPGTGEIIKVGGGAIGIRGIMPVNVELSADGLYYIAPKTESINEADETDTVTMDVPLMLRMFEYAREDAQEDMDLHDIAQRLIELSKRVDVVTMEHYDAIVSGNVDESLRTDNPCWKGYKPVGTKKKAGRTVPNCVPEGKKPDSKGPGWMLKQDPELAAKVKQNTDKAKQQKQTMQKYAGKKSVSEMDKSSPQPGRDGKISHSTYGSRDKHNNSNGPDHYTKAIKAKDVVKAGTKALDKAFNKK